MRVALQEEDRADSDGLPKHLGGDCKPIAHCLEAQSRCGVLRRIFLHQAARRPNWRSARWRSLLLVLPDELPQRQLYSCIGFLAVTQPSCRLAQPLRASNTIRGQVHGRGRGNILAAPGLQGTGTAMRYADTYKAFRPHCGTEKIRMCTPPLTNGGSSIMVSRVRLHESHGRTRSQLTDDMRVYQLRVNLPMPGPSPCKLYMYYHPYSYRSVPALRAHASEQHPCGGGSPQPCPQRGQRSAAESHLFRSHQGDITLDIARLAAR